MAAMTWEVFGHAPPARSKWALPCAGVLFIGTLGLGQGLVSSRAQRLLGPEADTDGWGIRFSQPAFMRSAPIDDGMLFMDPSLGLHSPRIYVIRLEEGPRGNVEHFCGELWQAMFGPLVPGGHLAAITLAENQAWEVVGPDGAEVMRLLPTARGEAYVFAYTAGGGTGQDRSRDQFDAVCKSVRIRSPR